MNIVELKKSFDKKGDESTRPSDRVFEIFEHAAKIASEEGSDTVYTQHFLKALFAPGVLWIDPNYVAGGSEGEKARRLCVLQEIAKKLSESIPEVKSTPTKITPWKEIVFSEHITRMFSNAKSEHMRIKSPELILSYMNFKPKDSAQKVNGKKIKIKKSKNRNVPLTPPKDLGTEILERAGLSENTIKDIAKSVCLFHPPKPLARSR